MKIVLEPEDLFNRLTKSPYRSWSYPNILAIRRCGELLAMIPAKTHGGGANQHRGGPSHHRASGRAQAASAAGIKRDAMKTALRVAKVPQREFERAVERKKPAATGALA